MREYKMLSNKKNSRKLTYRQYATKIHRILMPNYNIDIFTVPYFNIYQCWEAGLNPKDVISICLGLKDSPFDDPFL